MLLRAAILTPSPDEVEEPVHHHRILSLSPLFLSPTHRINFLLSYIFFLFTIFTLPSVLPHGYISRASFSPQATARCFSFFPSAAKHGRHHANLVFFFLSPDSGHLAKNSCPMGAGIHRRGFIFILYLFIYPCLNIDPREQKGGGGECHMRVT